MQEPRDDHALWRFEGQLELLRDQDAALQFHVFQHKRMMTFSWWVPTKLQLLDDVVVQCVYRVLHLSASLGICQTGPN
jgi:hypothetical protein